MRARFVRLAIAGFKSFAEPATIEILPGLTGVVGPNGCGKSNVADALRWAMGEIAARTMRAAAIDDVIFAGTASRPGRTMAEVSLTLERADDDAPFPPPFAGQAELAVVRRVERGGGSAFRVNGRDARARDVQTLFADLQSGARSCAMVSQGRVGALVSARPDDRRQVLEEAAGITGLHARRAEAEARLRAAETNLERAEERRASLAARLDGLLAQARHAARHAALSAATDEAEAMALLLARSRIAAVAAGAAVALERARALVSEAAAGLGAATRAAQATQVSLQPRREADAVARTGLERARLAGEGMQAEIARARAALVAADARQAQVRRDLAHAEQGAAEAGGTDARLDTEAARLRTEAGRHPALLAAAQDAVAEAASALAVAEVAASAAAEQAASSQARAAGLQQIVLAAETRAKRANDAIGRLEGERTRVEAGAPDQAALRHATDEEAAGHAALTMARARAEAADTARTGAVPAAGRAREQFNGAEAVRSKLAAEIAGLSQALLIRDGGKWPPLVDQIEVAAGLEAALGAALGEGLAAAADPGAPRHWRVLPTPQTAVLVPPGEPLAASVRGPPLLARALAGVSVVDEADGDAAQAALQPGQTVVSRTGAAWRWDGYTVRAGAPAAAAVRLQQRNRLNHLRGELAAAEAVVAQAQTQRDAADATERAATTEDAAARAALRAAETVAERARAAGAGLRGRAAASAARLEDLRAQLEALAPERTEADVALIALRRERDDLPDATGLRIAAERSRAAQAAARGRDRDAQLALAALERAEAARQHRLHTIERERDDARMRAEDARSRVVDLAARLNEAAREAEALADGPAAASRRAAQVEQTRRDAEAAQRTAAAALAAAEAEDRAAAIAARGAEGALYAAREALVRAEAAADTAQAGLVRAEAAMAERAHTLNFSASPPDGPPDAEERARARWQRLLRERDAMGPVNPGAAAEAEALAAEVSTLATERDELATAIATLRGGIGHLNREGRERLLEVFRQVDRHFQLVFARLFGGGRAHLALVGSDDPLQAGLEIHAQPPGKKLVAMSLLSGGEQALTALSLIFAVFRCNPAPLCVLDEVDAPLDDSNVGRFCALLADTAAETGTRFLVVTHHHLTMARMDRLYGVTMEERGVSRLLSVDLGAAVRMVDAAA